MEPTERQQWQDKYSDPSKPQRSNVIPLNCLNEGLNKEQQEFSENQHQSEMSLMQARPLKGNTGPEDQQTMVKRMCEFALKNLNDPRCVQQFGNMMKSFTMSQLDHLNGEPEADAQDAVKHHHIELEQSIEEYEHRIEEPEHQIEEPEYPIEEPEYHIEEPEYHIEEPEQSIGEPQELSDSRDQKTMSNLTKNLDQVNCQGDQQISHKLEKTNEYQKLPSFLKEKRAPQQISHNSDQSLVKESLMEGSLGTNRLQSRAPYEEDKYDPSSSDSNTSESGSSDCSWKDSLYQPPPRTFDPDHLSDAHVFSEAEVFSDSYSDDTKECGYFKVSQVDNVLNSGSQEPNDSSENDSQPEAKEYSGIISLKMIKTTCKEIYLEEAPENSSRRIFESRGTEFIFLHILLVIPEFVQYYTQKHPEWDADEEKFKFSKSIRQVIYQYFDEDIEKINISEFWDLLKNEVDESQKNNLLAFFMTLLERLEEEKRLGISLTFNKRFNNPYTPTLVHTTFDPSNMKQDRQLFIGTYEVKYQCKTCWNSNIEYEKFMNIPINFYKNDSYKGFQEFLEMHKIRTSGKMHCKHCSRNQMLLNQSSSHELQDCFVQKRIVEYPLCLIVVISKRNNFKQFMNFELDFSHGFPSPVHYTNIGIILHTGSTRCGYEYCTRVKVNGKRKLIIPSERSLPLSITKFGFHDHILVYSLQSKD